MNVPHLTLMQGLAWLIGLLVVWSIYRAQKNVEFKEFNLFDLLMENGKLSRIACVFIGTWTVTSLIMWQLVVDAKMTEGYFTAYAAAWIAPIISKLFAPPLSVSSSSSTTTSTVEVTK